MEHTLEKRARQSLWLLEIKRRDDSVSAAAVHLGMLVALKYVNSKSGEAWPSQKTLAHDLQTTERSIRRDLAILVRCGFLEVVPGSGRMSSRYKLRAGDGERTKTAIEGGPPRPGGGRTPTSTDLSRKTYNQEGLEQTSEPRTSSNSNSETHQPPTRTRVAAHMIPSDWKPGKIEIEIATVLGFDAREIDALAPDFKTYWLATKIKRPGWTATWRNWVRRRAAHHRGSKSIAKQKGGLRVI